MTPIAIVNYDGSISVHHEALVNRVRALELAHEFLHAVMESRGFDAVRGVASGIQAEDMFFIFGEFHQVRSVLTELNDMTVIQWIDDGVQSEITVHQDTEVWTYRSAM